MRRLLPMLLLLLASLPLAAQVDPALFQELQWRLIGPFRGGRVLAVSGVPGEPEHFYFGSVNGGVWESRDAGRTWGPIFDGQPVGSIGALAVAPSDPKTLYVGTGESDMRSDISQGEGMFKSVDGGRSWSRIGLTDSQQIARIRVHPTDPSLVYVAALGHPYGPNAERGVFRSKDGGATWQKILSRNDDRDTGAIDFAFEPGNPKVIYAALWQTRRTPWSVYPPSNGPGSGLFKSTDGGDSWTELRGHGLPDKPGRIGIAVAPSRPQRVYAIIDAKEGGMYRSDDGGATWAKTSGDARIWGRGWYFGEITVEPDDPDVVFSLNVNLYRSADGGKTFAPVKGAPGGDDYHVLWIDSSNPQHRILGVDQGAVVSVNGGRTWSSWYNQPTGQFYHAITDNRFPYWVYGAQQDSGAAGVPSRTNTLDGITLAEFREVTAGGESDNVAPDPKDPDLIFGGRVEKLDLKTWQTQSIDPTLAHEENPRRTWTLPLVFSRTDPRILYFANQKLHRTEDGGNHWSIISPDLTRENPGTPANLDSVTAALHQQTGPRRGVIYAIAPSRLAAHDLWVGTDDGLIWRTKDEGAHWTDVTPPALTAWSKVGTIETSHFDAETAYAAIDRHRLDDFRPYIYRTHDGGKSWTPIAAGIAATHAVNVVREDPVKRGLLYAGTERGVYVSFDDGDHWQPLQKNLPVTSVRDIDVHGNDVVVGTHGRAFWILDDVTPLRQTAAAPAAAKAYLFEPALAIRVRPAGFTGTPMPKDEALAPNPPAGAYIDYFLRAAATQPVTLDILEESGARIRRYSSADPVSVADPAKLRTSPEWFETPAQLRTTPGMHRFVWPLRYPAPEKLGALRWMDNDGIWARPGTYKAVLTVDGQTFTQPLTVAPDPRLKLADSAYDEQFAMARDVVTRWTVVHAALSEAEKLLESLAAQRAAASGDALARLVAREERVAAVTGEDWSGAKTDAPVPPQTLRALDQAFSSLYAAVDGADVAPTVDAREGFTRLRAMAEKTLAEWEKVKGETN
jgi:photosystem II stability/assembly factor-like uncharacterized protein